MKYIHYKIYTQYGETCQEDVLVYGDDITDEQINNEISCIAFDNAEPFEDSDRKIFDWCYITKEQYEHLF